MKYGWWSRAVKSSLYGCFLIASFLHGVTVEGLTADYFDVTAKYIYAKARDMGVNADWPVKLYRDHLCVMNTLNEASPTVITTILNRFQEAFDTLLDAVKNKESSQQVLKIMERYKEQFDYSHLVAAYLFYHRPLPKEIERVCPHVSFTAGDFRTKGDDSFNQCLDAMALQYCELKDTTFVSLLFPCIDNRYEEIESIFRRFGTIVHEKTIEVTLRGALNLVLTAYDGASYLGSYANNFAGARTNVVKRFINKTKRGMYQVKVILFECENQEVARLCKTAVRELFDYGPYPIHINDTHLETMTLARAVFNENSIDFLNRAHHKKFANFDHHLDYYNNFLQKNKYDSECFCIDGSTIMAVHGLRDCDDVDFLHYGYDFLPKQLQKHPIIHSHNLDTIKHHPHGRDEIIFDPANYFYYKNLKFATLQELKATKEKRKLKKDFVDVRLIERCLSRYASGY
ncbi:MAG: hypothetical protein WCT20_01190 [Candidatus Babeliales bacterium]